MKPTGCSIVTLWMVAFLNVVPAPPARAEVAAGTARAGVISKARVRPPQFGPVLSNATFAAGDQGGNITQGGAPSPGPLAVVWPTIVQFGTNNLVRLTINGDGHVGIGTAAPAQKLSVAGTIESTTGGFKFPDGSVQTTAAVSAWTPSTGAVSFTTGNVGIGTTTPAALLTVSRDSGATANTLMGTSVGMTNHGLEAGLRLESTVNGAASSQGTTQNAAGLTVGYYGPNDIQFAIGAASSIPITFRTTTGALDSVTTERVRITPAGNVGIGTRTPVASLHVRKAQDAITGLLIDNDGVSGSSGGGQAVHFGYGSLGPIGGVYHYTNGVQWSMGLRVWGGTSAERLTIRGENGNVGVGTTAPAAKLHVAGDIIATGNISAHYQDVAEWVDAAAGLAPGTVVAIDPDATNRVVASDRPYDVRVIGVVSERPGIVLGEPAANRVLVAQSGRVRVNVDAGSGPVRAGDLLVTSPRPGYAMRSQPVDFGGIPMHRPGTVLGKALESIESGTGMILVLLTLQ